MCRSLRKQIPFRLRISNVMPISTLHNTFCVWGYLPSVDYHGGRMTSKTRLGKSRRTHQNSSGEKTTPVLSKSETSRTCQNNTNTEQSALSFQKESQTFVHRAANGTCGHHLLSVSSPRCRFKSSDETPMHLRIQSSTEQPVHMHRLSRNTLSTQAWWKLPT